MIRSAFYIDGFNVYHALDRMKRPHLKWLDWMALASILVPSRSEQVTRVVMCTAQRRDDTQKLLRHRAYLAALRSSGVDCLTGHFAKEERECRSCGSRWQAPIEKQGDVHLAISVVDDAYQDVYNKCYLVTADSDQAATVRLLRERFPNKEVVSVILPGQTHSKAILGQGAIAMKISEVNLERSLFPKLIVGDQAVLRPPAYDPPGI